MYVCSARAGWLGKAIILQPEGRNQFGLATQVEFIRAAVVGANVRKIPIASGSWVPHIS
jgi:hypothetical protein